MMIKYKNNKLRIIFRNHFFGHKPTHRPHDTILTSIIPIFFINLTFLCNRRLSMIGNCMLANLVH